MAVACEEGVKDVYLDYQATTPMGEGPQRACSEALRDAWGNPSSGHHAGRKAKEVRLLREREARLSLLRDRERRRKRDLLFFPLISSFPLLPPSPLSSNAGGNTRTAAGGGNAKRGAA
jgi:hypothetical protein